MFDLGWSELLLIGIVALIVVGPKDLPVMFRTLGRFTAKLRNMAREFQRAMDQAADDSGVKDVARDLKTATSEKAMGLDTLKDAASKFEKWDPKRPLKSAAKAATAAAGVAEAAAEVTASTAAATSKAAAAPEGSETRALAEKAAARAADAESRAAEYRARRSAEPAAAPPPADEGKTQT